MSLESHKYPNGFTVHVDTMPGRSVTTMSMHIPFGSVHEASGEEGIERALEHAVFAGTAAFKSLSAIDLHGQLNGMYHNALTSYTNTIHETRSLAIAPALHHLSQVLLHAKLPAKGIASEMKSIRREARMQLDDLDEMHDVAGDYALFGHPYGRDIIGFHDRLNFTVEQLRQAYRNTYTLGSMTLIVAGAATMDEVVALLPRYFDTDAAQPANRPNAPAPVPYRESATTGLLQPGSSSLRLSVSHPIPREMVAKIQTNEELYDIAAGVMRDECFEVMRYERGLSYESDIEIADCNHPNAWVLRGSVQTDGENRAKATKTLHEALSKPGKSYGSTRIQGALAMGAFSVVNSLESTGSRVEAYIELVDRGGSVQSVDATTELVQSLTLADVRAAIDDLVEIANTTPRFEHRSGTKKSVGSVDALIDRAFFI